MPIANLKLNLDNSSATKVAALQQIASAGNLTLTAAASAIDSSGAARILVFTTNEDDSAVNATIIGLDADGNSISEVLALPVSTTKVSTKAYASVSQIALSAGITANMSVGTVSTTLTANGPTLAVNYYVRTAIACKVHVTGTINYSIQECFENILLPTSLGGTGTANAVFQSAPSALVSKTADAEAQLDIGTTGVRILINSYSNGATISANFIEPSNSNLG